MAFFGNTLRGPNQYVGGAAIVGAIVLGSTIADPSMYEYSGAEPLQVSDSIYVYPPFNPDSRLKIQWPLVLQPFAGRESNPLAGAEIEVFSNTPGHAAAMLIDPESVTQVNSGTYTCSDGKEVPYIATQPLSKDRLEAKICDVGSSQSAEAQDSQRTKAASKTGSAACKAFEGGDRILCEAQRFEGVWYGWGMGHISAAAFQRQCPDPSNPPKNPANKPHNGPPNPYNGNVSGNANACAVDCSSLVSQAVNKAFSESYIWHVGNGNAKMMDQKGRVSPDWKMVNIKNVKPGDIVTTPGHVELVEYRSKKGVIHTFGAHKTGTRVGSAVMDPKYAFRYTGDS